MYSDSGVEGRWGWLERKRVPFPYLSEVQLPSGRLCMLLSLSACSSGAKVHVFAMLLTFRGCTFAAIFTHLSGCLHTHTCQCPVIMLACLSGTRQHY